MPTINPLLYSDTSEDEVLSMPGAQAVAPPKVGAMAGFGAAVATTASNTAAAVWATGKEAVERATTGQAYDKLTERAPDLNMPKMEKIDPLTTGTAAQILAPLAVDIPLTVLSLGAGAAAAGARERLITYGDLREQGVDGATARTLANEKGAEIAGTFAITRVPFAKALGSISSPVLRIGAKAATGAATMTGIDYLGGETRGAILEAHGYTKQAEQMRHWDAMRFASDVIGGSLLGVTTRAHVDEPAQLSARWWQQADSLQHETAPGIPTTPEAAGATADATAKAVNDITAGNPVDVADIPELFDAHFLAKTEADIKETKGYIAEHEKVIANYDKQISQAQKSIEKARAKGHDDVAEYWEQELPRLQAIKQSSERIADQHREDLARLENPEAKTPAQQLAEPHLTAHAEDMAAITAKAEEFKTPPADTTPAAMADKGEAPKRDVAAEAKEMLTNYRNPVQEAATGEAKAAPAPKLSPEQQELVNMHAELRQLADATGDTDLHAELDEAMAAHQAAHAESAKYNVAALCAIG
ncbi:hypothetical protein [Leclercia sp. Marseille-Q4284]|uniref:hypothetical protein n=1 Tax=Leclercia sp. Marseille-Q4284 TaxID=2866582 RepID=UPI001CE3F379|nr:hypothetical protein [Leclercia sp. Marseille-Q4284]